MNKTTAELMLKEYKEKKDAANALEKQIAEMREKILNQIPSGKYGKLMVIIEEKTRESFEWTKAKASLSPSVLSKLLAFVKNSEFKTVKVEEI